VTTSVQSYFQDQSRIRS